MKLDKFASIQGAIFSVQKCIGLLNNITNDDKEKLEIINAKVGKAVKLAQLSNVELGDLFLLLFMNTDTELYHQLKSDEKCSHLVGYLPTISKYLLSRLIGFLELQQFFYKSIIFTEGILCQQFLNISLLCLKQLDEFKAIGLFENVAKAMFDKLTHSTGQNVACYFKIVIQHFEKILEDCKQKWETKEKEKLYRLDGFVICSELSLLSHCLKHVLKNTSEVIEQDSSYSLFLNFNKNGNMIINEKSSTDNKQVLVNICDRLVAKCFDKLSLVTLDIYLYWTEIELDNKLDTEYTLQKKIRELSYECILVLDEAEKLEIFTPQISNLISCLSNIALKPQIKEEQIEVDTYTFCKSINEDGTISQELLDKFFITSFEFTPDIADICFKYLHLLNSECRGNVLQKGLNYAHTHIKDCSEIVKQLVLEVVKQETLDIQLKILEDFIKNYGLLKILLLNNFKEQCTNTFNKVAKYETQDKKLYPDIIILAMQDSEAVVKSAVFQGINSELQGHLMADILCFIKCVCFVSTSTENKSFLLLDSIKHLFLEVTNLSDNCKTNYPLFVNMLVKLSLLDGSSLVVNTILPMFKFNSSQDIAIFSLGVDVITCFVKSGVNMRNSCIFAALVEVLHQSRSSSVYCYNKMAVCEKVIALIDLLVHEYNSNGWTFSETEEKELKLGIKHHQLMNKGYLLPLLPDIQAPSDSFDERLFYMIHVCSTGWSISEMSVQQKKEFSVIMSTKLFKLTRSEWEKVFQRFAPTNASFIELFLIMSDSILLLKYKAATADIQDSLVYCCLTIGYMINEHMVKWDEIDEKGTARVFHRFGTLINELQYSKQEECSATFMKILIDLLKMICKQKCIAKDVVDLIMAGIFSLKLTHVRKAVADTYVDIVKQV